MNDWKSEELTRNYLTGVRGAIPLAKTQLELIHRLIRALHPDFQSFLDLGCGDGILGRSLLDRWSSAECIFLDFSEPMIKEAKLKSSKILPNCKFVIQDYSTHGWTESIQEALPLDLVVSGFSIHHLEDDQKVNVYRDIFEILKPGGLFLNLEHVASQSAGLEQVHDEMFIDNLLAYQQKIDLNKSRSVIEQQYYHREDKILNKLSLVETQCEWLRDIGFQDVDCYFKIFELALFGGKKHD